MKKLISLIFINCLMFQAAFADQKGAGEFISKVADKVINIVQEQSLDNKEKEGKLTAIFEDVVDVQWISKFVLGRYINSISKDDLETYEKYYNTFLVKSYIPNFKKYTGQKFKLLGVTEAKKDQYRIATEIIGQHNSPIDIDYMVREENGTYKIFDIIAENVSLIATQRSEFSSVLGHQGIDYLISQLKERANIQ